MTIDVEDKGGKKLVHLGGELADENEALVETVSELLEAGGPGVIINLEKVTYINSSGLNGLVRLVAQANTREQRIILVKPSPFVEGVFQATKLDQFFEICPTTDEALDRFE